MTSARHFDIPFGVDRIVSMRDALWDSQFANRELLRSLVDGVYPEKATRYRITKLKSSIEENCDLCRCFDRLIEHLYLNKEIVSTVGDVNNKVA